MKSVLICIGGFIATFAFVFVSQSGNFMVEDRKMGTLLYFSSRC